MTEDMDPQADEPSSERRGLPHAVALVGLAFLTAHFVATALYINPVSVVGLAWHPPVAAYLEPLFRQRWSLFAPDPPLLDRRLDYQCEIAGEPGEWLSRSDTLLQTHARRRFSPAASLRRLETAAIVATVGSQDQILTALLASQDHASDEQRERIEDRLATRTAANIVASETAYRLVLAHCREDLGAEPDRLRYRIVTTKIVAFSVRNDPSMVEEPQAMTLPWLGVDDFDSLELRAREYLEAYKRIKLERSDG